MSIDFQPEALHALEWPRFVDLAEADARSEPGRGRIRALLDPGAWAQDLAAAQARQQETQEMVSLLDRDALWGPLSDLTDPAIALERLRKGSVLEISELAQLRRWLYAVDSWAQVPRDEIRGERFRRAITQLSDPHLPLRILDRVLTPEGELSEKASPRLGALHAEIRSLKREISSSLDQLLKTFSQRGILQENFTDVRDGRYVIPIKISHQGDVDGIVYEASASRQTVFVEPSEISPLNNRLRQRQNDLIQEVHAVLQDTSEKLKPFEAEIGLGADVLSYWDSVQARARFGRRFSGKPVLVSEGRTFKIRQTAHPLLWWSIAPEQIIRNDIEFGDPVRSLLLTGPNTGGKTVFLKTLGIAGLCARSGFPFPAVDAPEIPYFDQFFADLGDPQSIEAHLSSFSGHVQRYNLILGHASHQSLILLDELNTATDPEEGAALGRAFLETVMERGSIVVTTTHDPHLKALAVANPQILNAGMEFDEATRMPTYRILLGVPGRSRALETAERLGFPRAVLELAKSYLSQEHREFEGLLAKLETDASETDRLRREAQRLKDEAERLQKQWTERTEGAVNELLDRTRQRLRRILEQAQDQVRSSVQKLDEMKSRREIDSTRAQLNETLTRSVKDVESALREEAPEIARELEKSAEKKGQAPAPDAADPEALVPGTTVRVPKWKSTGQILERAGDRLKVQMGAVQVNLSIADVVWFAGPKPPRASARVGDAGGAYVPPSQLDLRGMRLDDAMVEFERYIDLAYRSGSLVEVTIIHGLGTGALREGTLKRLRKLPYVKSFRDGGAGAGGAGATLVEFER